ncbi:signal recognition particle-docking protein FtsY [Halomonas tibetensis]|uniref:Signal recognition particle receptor FtsY n=1 Tax=Halomonas tibetensis TaxID=2259590 RepID=A0ABV7B5N2_9GAMM
MFGFLKRKKKQQEHEATREEQERQEDLAEAPEALIESEPEPERSESIEPLPEPLSEALPEKRGVVEAEPEPEREPERQPESEVVVEPGASRHAPEPVEEVAKPPTMQAEPEPEPPRAALQEKPVAGEKKGWFSRIKAGLGKTRANLTDGLADLFLGKKQIDDDLMEDLETQLLLADVGIEATTEIIDRLTERVSRKELQDSEALYRALQEELSIMLEPVSQPLILPPKGDGPFVILVVGVNGAGKTTTIGKLTQRFQREGRSVMLAAGDTFRAAAVEQLKVWGERNKVPVIAQHTGADSASVIFDAVAAAKARGIDVLIADTAGRLHNKSHLMEELKKVHRVMGKVDAKAPHEVMLVLDAGTGQNALAQASTFNEAVPITGVTLTKLDGTAKGGIIFALAKQMTTPIRFIGVGESLDDLRPFVAREFVDALFDRDGNDDST